MRLQYTAAALAVLALGTARADDGNTFRFSGFGTLSAVHSNVDNADFVGTFFQPNGAGYTRRTSLAPDSKLGGQIDGRYGEKLSGVLQVVVQHQADNSYTPQVEWANVKYQVSPEVSVRLGRIALPTFQVSDSRFVGYANTSVRMPLEVYDSMPITSSDGVDATYRSKFGQANNTLQAFAGQATVKLPGDGKAKANRALGVQDTLELGSLALRAGFNAHNVTVDIPGINALIGGFNQFAAGAAGVPLPAYQAAAAQARALVQQYEPKDLWISLATFGATYDPGAWFVSGEYLVFKGKGLLPEARAWYAIGGYRFGSLTPYGIYASSKADVTPEPGISTVGADPLAAGAAALSAGLNAVRNGFAKTQSTVAVGLRWDFANNLSMKSQYEQVRLGATSTGHLGNVQPGFVPGGKVNVVSVAVDFVF